jgi:uncharacterized protein YegJ (DUF2314 family)
MLKNKKILFFCLISIIAILVVSYANKKHENPSNIKSFSKDDPRVIEAKNEAQNQINTFISIVKDGKCNTSYDCSVKRDFVQNNQHEHMWIIVYSYNNGVFYGTLDDTPEFVTNIKYQDPSSAKQDEVEDWLLHKKADNTFEGAFLIKLIK